MASTYTTDYLINDIKRRGGLPTTQDTFEDEDLLAVAYGEMTGTVIPAIFDRQEEFFVDHEDVVVSGDVEDNSFPIPAASLYADLRDASIFDPSGVEHFISRVDPKFGALNSGQQSGGNASSFFNSWAFFIRNNTVHIVNRASINSLYTVRLYYFRRPNYLVPVTDGAEVRAVDTVNNLIQLSRFPSDFVTGASVCGIKGTPGFDLRFAARTITTTSSPYIGLADVSDLSVGDFICLEGQSIVPQIPADTHFMLAQATVAGVLEGQGDVPGATKARMKYELLEANWKRVSTPRDTGSPQKVSALGGRLWDMMRVGYGRRW